MNHTRKPVPFIAVFLCLVSLAPALRAAESIDKRDKEHWYQVQLQGQPAGWMHNTEKYRAATKDQPATIESATEMSVSFKRGSVAVAMGITCGFVETADGGPISATSSQRFAGMAIERTMTFHDGKTDIVVKQAGQEQRQTVETSKGWMAPAAAGRYVEEQLRLGVKVIRSSVLDPSVGVEPIETVLTILEKKDVELMGRVVPATRATMTVSNVPAVKSEVYIDEAGDLIRYSMPVIPGMAMDIVETDKVLAKAQINPPELMAGTLIKPDVPIKNARGLRSAVYEVTLAPVADGTVPKIDLLRAGYQRVTWGDERTAVVAVDLDDPVNPVADLPGEAHRRATPMLNFKDPEVQKLLDNAVKSNPEFKTATKAQTAEWVRRYVHGFINSKDLSVGFASASEVARTRQGDCTEHAVLLAALLRGAGIPSRTVSGLIYVDRFMGQQGVFGYHMWAQAWFTEKGQSRWVDLDATLPDETPFDATHIALAVQTMRDEDVGNDMVPLVGVIGRLSIHVIEAGK
ncbi:MAG: transglutaminase domain-containing protein [Planctomycetes bacterium]|nr:transglutaminase domain-containing protein [Planctomycetota bacterium]